jgi:hypothetical protein
MKLPKLDSITASIGRSVTQAKTIADTVEKLPQPKPPTVADAFEAAGAVGKYAVNLVTSDGAWGESVPADTGTQAPFRVGYGQVLKTIAEAHTPRPHGLPSAVELAGARGRVFGDASAQTLSAAIGVEAEAGLKLTDRHSSPGLGDSMGEVFVGARTRHAAEAGVIGSSVMSESFVGAEAFAQHTISDGAGRQLTLQGQVQAGFRAAARVGVNAFGLSAEEHMEIGVRARMAAQDDQKLLGPIGRRIAATATVFAGMTESGHAKAGVTGLGAGGEWFAGVKAEAHERAALTLGNTELLGLGVKEEAWAGLGAKANAGIGWDSEEKHVDVKVEGGVAMGIGGAVGVELTFGGDGIAGVSSDDE